MSDFYKYLGKSNLDIKPLVSYLSSSLIPLYEDTAWRKKVESLRTQESRVRGFPPVPLDQNWNPIDGPVDHCPLWCLPFSQGLYTLGGLHLSKMFPEFFSRTTTDSWANKLLPYLSRPTIILTNQPSTIHIDSDRQSAINTFLYNTDISSTEFYKDNQLQDSITYTPGDTYLINIRQQHKIEQPVGTTRCVLSWGFVCKFDKAVEILNEI